MISDGQYRLQREHFVKKLLSGEAKRALHYVPGKSCRLVSLEGCRLLYNGVRVRGKGVDCPVDELHAPTPVAVQYLIEQAERELMDASLAVEQIRNNLNVLRTLDP